MNRQANMPMDLFLSYKLDQCKGCISFFLIPHVASCHQLG